MLEYNCDTWADQTAKKLSTAGTIYVTTRVREAAKKVLSLKIAKIEF